MEAEAEVATEDRIDPEAPRTSTTDGPRPEDSGPPRTLEQAIADTIVDDGLAPALTLIGERLRSRLMVSLRNHTSSAVELAERIEVARYGDVIGRIDRPVVAMIAEPDAWAAPLLVLCDDSLVHSLVDLLMGGGKGRAGRPERWRVTSIEQRMVERTIQIVLDDLAASLAPLVQTGIAIKRVETNPRFAGIARDSEIAVVIRLALQFERSSGTIDIVIPRATLDPVRDKLAAGYPGAGGPRDAGWEDRLRRQLTTAPVEVKGLLPVGEIPLKDIMGWRSGTQIVFDATPDSAVLVTYGGMKAWTGLMGRRAGRVAISLDRKVLGNG